MSIFKIVNCWDLPPAISSAERVIITYLTKIKKISIRRGARSDSPRAAKELERLRPVARSGDVALGLRGEIQLPCGRTTAHLFDASAAERRAYGHRPQAMVTCALDMNIGPISYGLQISTEKRRGAISCVVSLMFSAWRKDEYRAKQCSDVYVSASASRRMPSRISRSYRGAYPRTTPVRLGGFI